MLEAAIIIIPARMASTRFPNKPLTLIKSLSMIERVWRIAQAVPQAREVFIATDDQQLKQFVEGFGAKAIMTSPECPTGTDRVAEASRLIGMQPSIIFSFQGDAVLTPPWVIEEVLKVMLCDKNIQIATPAIRLTGSALADFIASKQHGSSTGTTVTFNIKGDALYFSKSLIPYSRKQHDLNRTVFRHIGLYAYRTETLQHLCQLPEGFFEKEEQLEQLRALENGLPIRIIQVDYKGRTHGSVDCPEDVAFVEGIIEREGELISI